MARRSRSSSNTVWIIAGAVALVLAFFGARWFAEENIKPHSKVEELDVRSYLENSNSLRGNVYRVDGEVLNSIAWSPTQGRLFSVGVDDNRDVIPVLIPSDLDYINVQKGQKFIFVVEVIDNGVLRAKELTKA